MPRRSDPDNTEKILITVTPELKAALQIVAKERERSVRFLIRSYCLAGVTHDMLKAGLPIPSAEKTENDDD